MKIKNVLITFIHRVLLIMCEDPFVGALGHIITLPPSLIRHPPSGDPDRVDQAPTCVPAMLARFSDLLIQIQLKALSATYVVDLMAFLLATPVMPSKV